MRIFNANVNFLSNPHGFCTELFKSVKQRATGTSCTRKEYFKKLTELTFAEIYSLRLQL
jgi:hypothetical protein